MNIIWQNEKAKAFLRRTCPSTVRILLKVAWLGFIAVSLIAGCATVRENTAQYGQARAKLDGQDVVVGYFKDFRRVQQTAPHLCWAACLEQALSFQGVDTDQNRIAEKIRSEAGGAEADRTVNMFWWRQILSVTDERLLDGSKVWVRLDMDGGATPILSIRTFVRKIARELSLNRIPIVGISEHGVGHMVTVIGAAYPIDVKRLTTDQIVGFLIYDPYDAKPQLKSAEELFKIFKALVYVTIFDSAVGAATGEGSTTLYIY